jgi:TRAP-type mannitol/chloroaromatic compound transport system substrate-binding protein
LFCSPKLLICFAIAALTFSFDVKLAASQAAYQWRLAMSWLEGTPMLSNAAVRFARNVEKMSGGRMRIIVDAPGRHKAPLGVFDMV